MHKAAWVMIAAGGLTAWGQNTPAPAGQSADHSTSYYYYTLGHMYADLGAITGSNQYINKAIENYKSAIKADPQSATLSEELTELYVQTGRLREAQTDAEEALRRNPNDLNALRLLARIFTGQIGDGPNNRVDENMLRRAIEQYKKITDVAPKDMESWLMLGRLEKVAQDSAEAEKAYKKALDLDPDNEDALTGLALVYSDLGDTQGAADLLRKLSEKNPSQRSLVALAAAYEQMHQYALAADARKRILSMNPPNSADIKREMARDLLLAEKLPDALQTYQELTSDDPNDAESFIRMSQIYRQQRNFAKAREAADKALAINPTDIQARFNQVNLLEAEGKSNEAIQTLKDILNSTAKKNYSREDKANRSQLLRQLAALERNADQLDSAIETYRQIVDLDADAAPGATADIVDTYREAHEFVKAEQEAQSALKKWADEKNPVQCGTLGYRPAAASYCLHVSHALLLADLNKHDQAAAEVKKLLDGKSDRETYIALAQVYDKGHKWDDMAKSLDAAEKLSEDNEERQNIWFMRGAMYERMKKIDLAEAQFKKVLEIDPTSAGAMNYIGYMLADRNIRLQEALEYITKAVDKEPENGAYLDSLGWIYFRLGRFPEAEEKLRKAVDKTPRDPTVHDHMAEVLMRQSKVKEAIAQWELSLKQWDAGAPADLEPAEVSKVKTKLENAKVRLARETSQNQK